MVRRSQWFPRIRIGIFRPLDSSILLIWDEWIQSDTISRSFPRDRIAWHLLQLQIQGNSTSSDARPSQSATDRNGPFSSNPQKRRGFLGNLKNRMDFDADHPLTWLDPTTGLTIWWACKIPNMNTRPARGRAVLGPSLTLQRRPTSCDKNQVF